MGSRTLRYEFASKLTKPAKGSLTLWNPVFMHG